jgi:hypothetical protein
VTAEATRLALAEAFGADAGVRATLGHPVRLSEPPPRGTLPAAVWRRWETRPFGPGPAPSEEHTVTLEILTREAGVDQARAAVSALVAAAHAMRPNSEQVRIILVLPVYSDVLRPSDQRGWYGIVRLKVIAEAA